MLKPLKFCGCCKDRAIKDNKPCSIGENVISQGIRGIENTLENTNQVDNK